MNTHTIGEEWEASLLHRVQAKGSKVARAWGAARAAQLGSGWRVCHGVATPPTHGGQLAGDDVATSLATPSDRARAEKEPATTTPPRTAALGNNNKVITTPHARAVAVGGTTFSCVGIGIAVSCSSRVSVSAAACCSNHPKLARAAFELIRWLWRKLSQLLTSTLLQTRQLCPHITGTTGKLLQAGKLR